MVFQILVWSFPHLAQSQAYRSKILHSPIVRGAGGIYGRLLEIKHLVLAH